MTFKTFDRFFIHEMRRLGVPTLRVALGIVFFWFGALKLAGASPVVPIIRETFSFLPTQNFLLVLGVWEVVIGTGLLLKRYLRMTLALLWLQLAGTFFAVLLQPALFFQQVNPLLLTMEGEFIAKNLILIAAGIVIGGQMKTKKIDERQGRHRQEEQA